MRLIDADAVYELHSNYPAFARSYADLTDLRDILDDAPTIEAEPVKHGRWIKVGGDMHSSGYAVSCSNCGKYHFVHYRGSLGGLYGHDELFEEPSQCPNCGAKMDGGNDHE